MIVSAVFYFILTLLLLIVVHESGHFLVARWCGVKVLRFSFGFGKILGKWRDKHGTEFTLSLLPLGGYVKFLDENEGYVAPQERHKAFNRQKRWIRIAIVLAGPVFNFLLAFLLLWLVAVIGFQSFAPRIASVASNTVAARGHIGQMQEIIALNGKKINSWRDVHYVLLPLVGSKSDIPITVKSLKDGNISTHSLALAQWKFDPKQSDLLESLGIIPLFPKLPVIVGLVTPESPAQQADLRTNDEILEVDGVAISDWRTLIAYVHSKPGEAITITIRRQGTVHSVVAHLRKASEANGGLLGIGGQRSKIPADWLRMERSDPLHAIITAAQQTVAFTATTMTLIGRTVTGSLSFEHISGPVGIAKAAGESAQFGLVYYLFFVALLSISLGVLNLLPIPLLDGGHLLFELLEIIIRRPLAKEWKMRGIFFGMLLVILLTLIALYNDLA
jgi:regulator of sigma E protease